MKRPADRDRSQAQLREHYEIERALARRLLDAPRHERARLYTAVYDELFQRVPHHPQVRRVVDLGAQRDAVAVRVRPLRRFLRAGMTFMEIGAGDCSLSIEVARQARKVYAVDVSAELTQAAALPANLEQIISDGSRIAVPRGTVDVAYSYQLIEHMHPDDAADHLRHVRTALCPGGLYLCVTPNRLSGPHDISKYFDEVATGLHLKEYTTRELSAMFMAAGFSSVRSLIGVRGHFRAVRVSAVTAVEAGLMQLPSAARATLTRWRPVEALLDIALLGRAAA